MDLKDYLKIFRPAATKKQPQTPKEPFSLHKSVLQYLHDLIYLMAVLLLVLLLCFRVVVVSGDSMNSTLYNSDYLLLLNNVFYTDPQRGDIVVVSKDSFNGGEPLVKRIVATENQVVDIDFETGIVYVDRVPLTEPYVNTPTNRSEGVEFPITVAPGCVFVLGDNRNYSRDSRDPQIGLVDEREIMGKAIFLILPGLSGEDEENMKVHFDRIGVLD